MKSVWIWRLGLGLGLIACFTLASRLYSHTFIEWTAGIFGAAVVIIEFILKLDENEGISDKTNRTESLLLRAFTKHKVLVPSTIGVWVCVCILACQTAFKLINEKNTVTIHGFIQDDDGTLLPTASITITVGTNIIRTSAREGQFTISSIPSPRGLHEAIIEARGAGKSITKTIDLRGNNLNNLVLSLPKGNPPFRVQYYLLGGYAFDLFLKGSILKEWDEKLSGHPYIIPNTTYQLVKSAEETYTEPFMHQYLYPQGKDDFGARQEAWAKKIQGMPTFVGTKIPILPKRITPTSIEEVSNPSMGWHVSFSPSNFVSNEFDGITFWRFGTAQDLKLEYTG